MPFNKIKNWIFNHKIAVANIGLCFVLVALVYTPACAPTSTSEIPQKAQITPPSAPTNVNQLLPQGKVSQEEEQKIEEKVDVEKEKIAEENIEETFLVTRVIDGDTIELENGEKVRYIGIDAPETVHPSKPVECFGREASAKNKELVENKRVRLEKDITDRDKYGRLLRYVYVGDLFVNLELVKLGYATSYTYPPDVKYQDLFIAAQKEARETQRGLWGACQETTSTPSADTNTNTNVSSSSPSNSDCLIKGNISSSSGEKIYHLPDCPYYNKTVIDESKGERWFCTEAEAQAAGWRKAKNCP
jgi:micrococcal nuclease